MIRWSTPLFLSISALLAFLLSISPLTNYFPQVIAFLTLIFFALHLRPSLPYLNTITLSFVSFTICFIIFSTDGLSSPLFFLIYFLLFSLAFQQPPLVTLIFSINLVIILSQSLNSLVSLIPLFSLLFIAPLAWFVADQHSSNVLLQHNLSHEETSTFFWLTLKFKNTILKIIAIASNLLDDPRLTPSQLTQIQAIKKHSANLLASSKELLEDIDSHEIKK